MAKLLLVLTVVLAAFAVACGDDDDDSEATPTPSVCDAKDDLDQSVSDLTDLDILASGTDGLTEAVDKVKTDLAALKTAASDSVAPDVEALETAVSDAEDTLSSINSDSSLNEKIDAVQEALTGIATAAQDLATTLQTEADCP